MSTRARIIDRVEDLVATAPFAAGPTQTAGGDAQPLPARGARSFVVEGIEDIVPLIRALDESGLASAHAGDADAVAFRATPAELAEVRERLLRRPSSAADAVVAALDAALGSARDLTWPGGRLALGRRALVMGIVNVTPDSFSDGGDYLDPEAAVKHGMRLVDEGADLLDVGGESTRPGADPVDAAAEIARVLPVIEGLTRRTGVPISIDTMKAEVARAALDAGAQIVNDVSAGSDPAMFALVAERQVPIVLMHMRGEPRTMQDAPVYRDVVGEVYGALADAVEAAVAAGVARERTLIDPGFGFGKTREHNLTMLRRLAEFTCLGRPVLVGTSRKSFIGTTLELPIEERLEGTAATVALAVAAGAAIVRVHDVGPMRRVVGMVEAVQRST